jgi:regulation of enolase protein 1 (concanavalin A-like superfamily)
MKRHSLILFGLVLLSCNNKKNDMETDSIVESNMTEEVISGLSWMNEPESFHMVDSSLVITVDKGTDFFNNPEDNSIINTAPFLSKKIHGDFVVKILVQPDFSSQWNAMALMMHIDSLHWIKLAFENSDATGPGIVTVVTNGTSDDANGAILNNEERIWLAMVRKQNIYSMHWSLDGKNFNMTRLTKMPDSEAVRVGIEAQSPVGEEAIHKVFYFNIDQRTVENLRKLD